MTWQPQYLLAKYIPQIERNEPRNIGVILWTPWTVVARFSGEKGLDVDGRKLPSWVAFQDTYKAWVHSWRRDIGRGYTRTLRGAKVESTSPEFLTAIAEKGSGNYILSDLGVVLDTVEKEDVNALLAYLFGTLVDAETDKAGVKSDYEIRRTCTKLIREVGLHRHDHLKYEQPVMCQIAPGVTKTFKFDYWVGNGSPLSLYQRVPYMQRGLDNLINATAWQYEKVLERTIIGDKSHVVSLILPTDEQRADAEFQQGLAVLETESRILDLTREPEKFQEELLAQLSGTRSETF